MSHASPCFSTEVYPYALLLTRPRDLLLSVSAATQNPRVCALPDSLGVNLKAGKGCRGTAWGGTAIAAAGSKTKAAWTAWADLRLDAGEPAQQPWALDC